MFKFGVRQLELLKKIGLQLGKAEIQRFKDGEVYIEIEETVRGRDVLLFNLLQNL